MAIMDRSMEGKRQYTTGISKGVFFGEDGKAFPWNGLISVTEKPQANAPTPVYNSLGEKYDQFGNIAEKKHSLTCYTYPEEMDEFLGIEYLEAMGYSVDERPPKKFSMAYRTELGDGLYEIHVLLNQIATFADTAKNTITNNITPTVVTMNLEGVPDPRIKSSHIILDSRLPLTESAERLLFGNNMVDGNINEFLDAQPTWVTVATNYAPIIEPDYDNMVWLGGENLFKNGTFDEPGIVGSWIRQPPTVVGEGGIRYASQNYGWSLEYSVDLAPGEYILSFDVRDPDPKHRSHVRITRTLRDSNGETFGDPATESLTWNNIPISGEWARGSVDISIPEGAANARGYILNGDANDGNSNLQFTGFKLERGSTATPWIPAPSDPIQTPRLFDPFPENYKPGVKYGSFWDSRANKDRDSIAFYDEENKGLGVYAIGLEPRSSYSQSRLAAEILPTQELNGSVVRASFEVVLPEPIGEEQSAWYSTIHLYNTGPVLPSPPKTRGVHYVESEVQLPTSTRTHQFIVFLNGGIIGSAPITFKNTMVSTPGYNGGFFDVNSIPPTKGDRYQRVTTLNGDYTIHQQLMLQSKSRVILSDITQNQYTLEASDSQLRVEGPTFEFKGPQATPVGDDQFTIDDEIYGEE